MLLSELTAFAIVAIYIVAHTWGQPKRGQFIIRIILVCAASWIAEESCILLYKFYDYRANWGLFLAHLPLLVIVIWPIIVHSAWNLASQLVGPDRRFVPLTAAAIVLTDASLIEPVGVRTGLWSWNQPGLFDVPPIGILGWAYFAFLCALFFETRKRPNDMKWVNLLILIVPVIGTHMLLLITWWAVFRWVKISIDPMLAAGSAWALSLLLVSVILKHRTGTRIKRKTLLLRLIGALFLFTWLTLNTNDSALLMVYAVAFAPPYLTLMAQQYLTESPTVNGA
jgi:hypothetical protein